MQISAPAKINLLLRVGRPRADGFHPLMSWMTTIALYDTLTFSAATPASDRQPSPATATLPAQIQSLLRNAGDLQQGDPVKSSFTPSDHAISMSCSDRSLPCDDRNIVVKAAGLLSGSARRSIAIYLEKNIPHGGGLGGGSSDAASALTALNCLWNLGKSVEELHGLASRLGSDVPFFLHGPSSICKGRGEVVTPVPQPARARWVLLILPDLSISTPAVYRRFDEMKLGSLADLEQEPDWKQWAALSSPELLPLLVNDLEAPAFALQPQLGELRARLENQLHRPVRMSGSGSSLFTLYDNLDEAAEAARVTSHLRALAVELSPQ